MFTIVDDPDTDRIPNLVVQMRKSLDLGGELPIMFYDGTKFKLAIVIMNRFLEMYGSIKPVDREEMQKTAIKSFDSFMEVVNKFSRPRAPASIYI